MKIRISIIGFVLFCLIGRAKAFQDPSGQGSISFPFNNMPEILPGTRPLTWKGDLSVKMLDEAHQFIENKIKVSPGNRKKLWNRNLSSRGAYEASVEPNRKRFIKCIGVEDKTAPFKNYNIGLPDG